MRNPAVALAILSLCLPGVASGAVIHVPSEQPTIQAGIGAAGGGDTVLVASDTYVETIDFLGKAVTVRSESGPEVTIIDGDQVGSVVIFASGESGDSVLIGFTIRNGSGTTIGTKTYGGGVFCQNASPTLLDCSIIGNTAGYGAGMCCFQAPATLVNCRIEGNLARFDDLTWEGEGGGIYCSESDLMLLSCEISGNTAGIGGGLYCDMSSSSVMDCSITGNVAKYFTYSDDDGNGGGVYCLFSNVEIDTCLISGNQTVFGGGIFCDASSPTISSCSITLNDAWGWGMFGAEYGDGGGIDCENASSPLIVDCTVASNSSNSGGGITCGGGSAPTIANCTIRSNVAQGGEIYGGGGGIACWSSSPEVINCLIVQNEALYYDLWAWAEGGGIYLRYSSPSLTNITLAHNWADETGGAINCIDSSPQVNNAILYGNGATVGDEIHESGSVGPMVSYSNIPGGYPGTGNIDVDPLFESALNDHYYLNYESPCVDSGSDPADIICYPTMDGGHICLEELTTRIDHEPDSGTVDMGFHYSLPVIQSTWTWMGTGNVVGSMRIHTLCETVSGSLFAGSAGLGTVHRSDDGGNTWTNTAVLVDAVQVNDLLVASDGKLFAATRCATPGRGGQVFVTDDGGLNWQATSPLMGTDTVSCLFETSDGKLLAGTGPNGDVFLTTDDGKTWSNTSDLVGAEQVLSLLEASDGSLYAGTATNGDIFRSTDGGANWANTSAIAGATHIYCLIENAGGEIMTGTTPTGCILRSADQGGTWEQLACLTGAEFVYDLALHADGLVYAATGSHFALHADGLVHAVTSSQGEVHFSDDGGETWWPTSNLNGVTQVYCLLPASDGYFYCGTGPNGDIFKSSGSSTIECTLSCVPGSGTIPFNSTFTSTLRNPFSFNRMAAGRLDVTLASGVLYSNWRAGYIVLSPMETFEQSWKQIIPNYGTLVGDNVFTLFVEDVTPSPWNQPPFPPSGGADTITCTVTGIAP